jgi:16S rRNA (cytosine1402-N4)-methyltransferase
MGLNRSDTGHLPVMAGEVVRLLVTDSNGAYLDLTAGLGGHLRALATELGAAARLYGIDKDGQAVGQARKNLEATGQLKGLREASYADVDVEVEKFEDRQFDGLLLDLGLSSDQLDDPERGFSFRHDGPLDMRFDAKAAGKTAADLVNALDEKHIARILRLFGEERGAARLARAIVRERQKEMILTTAQLARIVTDIVPPPHQTKSLARVFQAFRIAVNRELDELQAVLPKAVALLKVGGRLVVITYHSLEDRLVKRFLQEEARGCICPPGLPRCVCGHKPRLKILTRRVLRPTPEELNSNPRARSAKLRAAERLPL